MPISQKTVLALYGELHQLAYATEDAYNALYEALGDIQEPQAAQKVLAIIAALRGRATAAERAAIDTLMTDAPRLGVNPITGEIR
jgi:hypothetical protein